MSKRAKKTKQSAEDRSRAAYKESVEMIAEEPGNPERATVGLQNAQRRERIVDLSKFRSNGE